MIIVTGGYDGSQDVASTEVMDYSGEKILKLQLDNCLRTAKVPLIRSVSPPSPTPGDMVWSKVGELPSARSGFQGASVGGLFHVAGGQCKHELGINHLCRKTVFSSFLDRIG